jgi:hypothetical protein
VPSLCAKISVRRIICFIMSKNSSSMRSMTFLYNVVKWFDSPTTRTNCVFFVLPFSLSPRSTRQSIYSLMDRVHMNRPNKMWALYVCGTSHNSFPSTALRTIVPFQLPLSTVRRNGCKMSFKLQNLVLYKIRFHYTFDKKNSNASFELLFIFNNAMKNYKADSLRPLCLRVVVKEPY